MTGSSYSFDPALHYFPKFMNSEIIPNIYVVFVDPECNLAT